MDKLEEIKDYTDNTDWQPKANSLWLISEIERLTLANKGRHAPTNAQGKQIERLKKEKEFLLRNYSISKIIPIAQSEKEARNAILKAMQEALKEE